MRRRTLRALIVLLCWAMFTVPLCADSRLIPPSVTKVWPVGMQRGAKATFTLDGRNLAEIRAVIFDAPGITAKVMQITDLAEEKPMVPPGLVQTRAPVPRGKKQVATVEMTADPTAEPGLHWFRISTPLGTSNMMPIDISSFPEVHQSEGGVDMQPEAIKLPATLVGTITFPGRVDYYQFDGRAGEQLLFRVAASSLGSSLESLLVLRNDTGKVLAEAGRYENRADTVLNCTLAESGKYTLSVTDREKGGSAAHYYRIDAGPLPYITQVFPLGVRTGAPATISVEGVNLGGVRELKIDPPKSADGWATMPLRVKSGATWSLNTVRLAVGNDPEVLEEEPNNSPSQAQTVSLPVTINGHISGGAKNGGATDEDYFRFHARKGENVTIEVAAARLGSALDSVIEVLDTQGNPIPRSTVRCLNQTTVDYSGADSRSPKILFTSTSGFHETDYVMIGDELDQLVYIPDQPDDDEVMLSADGLRWALLGTSPDAHSLNSRVYRVEVLPPGVELPPNGLPVFHLTWKNDDGGPGYGADSRLDFVAPQDADYILHLKDVRGLEGQDFAYRLSLHDNNPDFLLSASPGNPNIPRGGSAFVTVNANRVPGYEGPIDISVEGLPRGVKAGPATIPAGQGSTVILLSADAGAPADATPAAFKIVGHARVNGYDLTRVANEEAPLELATVIPPPDAIVTARPSRITLAPGQDVKVTLQVERHNDFRGRVPCTIQNLPPGVRVVNVGLNGVVVTESQSTRTFILRADDWAKPISQSIYVVGEVESNSPMMYPSAPLIVEVVGNKQAASVSPATAMAGRGAEAPHSPNR